MQPLVLKFGGTSVADPAAIARVVRIVQRESGRRVVVVSALAGVTAGLVEAAATGGRVVRDTLATLERRHLNVGAAVTSGDRRTRLHTDIRALFAEAARAASDGRLALPARQDVLLAVGELAASHIVSAALQEAGTQTVWRDARDLVATDARHTRARPDLPTTLRNVRHYIAPALSTRSVPVVGGFVGRSPEGRTTTLGRGGSDCSAAVIAAAAGARELQIWSDVDGFLSADPACVSDAEPRERLSTAEAHELARFGARVLHPATLAPVWARRVPVRVLNSMAPHRPGTLIADGPSTCSEYGITGIADRRQVALVEARSDALDGSRALLDRARAVLADGDPSTTAVVLSPWRVCLVTEDADAERVSTPFRSAGRVAVTRDAGIVAIVGARLEANAVAAAALQALVREGLARGVVAASTGLSMVVMVPSPATASVVRRLHARLCGSPVEAGAGGARP